MTTKVLTIYNNFARAKTDYDLNGRFDLPIYNTSAEVFKNFISNFKGNAIYSAGFLKAATFQDCRFIEFKYNNEQQYICLFYENKIRFLSYDSNGVFGWVLDAGMSILEVDTPYTLEESKQLLYTQNFDSMEITHQNHRPRRLIRTSANEFQLQVSSRKNDPFVVSNTGVTRSITAITKAKFAQVTISSHGYSVDDSFTITGVSGMTEINNYTVGIVEVIDANNFTISVDTRNFSTYSSGGTANPVDEEDNPKCCLYFGARLYYANTPTKITTIFASVDGLYEDFTDTPIDDTSAVIFTLSDIAQEIDWIYGTDNALLVGASDGIVPVYGAELGKKITAENVETKLTSADAPNGVFPLKKDGYVFYVTLDGRHLNYFNYDLLSESFRDADSNVLSYDITRGGISKIRYKRDRNDLIFALCNNKLLTTNINIGEKIIGWHERDTEGNFKDIAVISNNNGESKIFALVERNGTYYVEIQADYVEFSHIDDFYTGNQEDDYEAYLRKTAEELNAAVYLDNARQISGLQEGNTITFDGTDTITATSPVFSSADVNRHISYKTDTGYESGRFRITGYTSTTEVTVEVLQTPTTNTYDDWYLSFNSISGLTEFIGRSIGVVTDGGFLNDFDIDSDTIEFEDEALFAVVGYKYKGVIKTFNLGFSAGRDNTQATPKAINRAAVRAVDSAGCKIGSSMYRLEPMQERTEADLNYLPTALVNGTKDVVYSDDLEVDKHLYIIQDVPLPLHITAVMLVAAYTVRR